MTGFGGHYIKYAQRNAMDIATLGCAVHVKLTADKISRGGAAAGVRRRRPHPHPLP